ncbi:MAG: hypothetical protein ABSF34_00200 [Verrucomicrobiota bacterium]
MVLKKPTYSSIQPIFSSLHCRVFFLFFCDILNFFYFFATWKTTLSPPTCPSIQSLCLQRRPQCLNAAIDAEFFPAKSLLMVKIRMGMIKEIGKVNFTQPGDQTKAGSMESNSSRCRTPSECLAVAWGRQHRSISSSAARLSRLIAPALAPPSVFCALNTLAAMMQSPRYPRRNR